MEVLGFLFRWSHVLFGITWIGMLYYFNFVQGGYFKQASPEGLADAKAKLAPSALWWFRWGAMGTFLTGLYLLHSVSGYASNYIWIGSIFGTLMFLNVWLVIWPNQQVALGMKDGDAAAAGAKALLASRHNVLFSAPMVFCMLASGHGGAGGWAAVDWSAPSMLAMLAIIVLLEINALKGKQGPLTTVNGVIGSSLVLTAVMVAVLNIL
ncbi:MAG TPA: antitermination protein NusG [Oceanospirillaceae bacterium]|nr:antitermination protein NusG [Oceanospirillaceae bacterium]